MATRPPHPVVAEAIHQWDADLAKGLEELRKLTLDPAEWAIIDTWLAPMSKDERKQLVANLLKISQSIIRSL